MGMKERDHGEKEKDDQRRVKRKRNEPEGFDEMAGSWKDKRREKGDKVLRVIRQKARNLSPAMETFSVGQGGRNRRERSESSGTCYSRAYLHRSH